MVKSKLSDLAIVKIVLAILVFPVALSVISIDIAIWCRVVGEMRRGEYFGSLRQFGQPYDLGLQLVFLAFLSLPLLLPVFWLIQRASDGGTTASESEDDRGRNRGK